jgi:DNA-binding transcriptional ArsR family regulator
MLPTPLDTVFSALSNPVRRSIVAHLAQEGPVFVGDLQELHDISLPAISRHVRLLEEAGLVSRSVEGRFRRCELNEKPMTEAMDWLREQAKFWEESLDRLERFLNQEAAAKGDSADDR